LQARANAARLPLGRTLPAVSAGNRIQIAHNCFVAGGKRAGHLTAQDQQIGYQPWLQAFSVDPVIGGERGHRAQDRRPLEIVERTADVFVFGQ